MKNEGKDVQHARMPTAMKRTPSAHAGIAVLMIAAVAICGFSSEAATAGRNAAAAKQSAATSRAVNGRGAGRKTATMQAAKFAPLETWKAAVLSGDTAKLKALYSSAPPAISVTPEAKSHDFAAEANFWTGVKLDGLAGLSTKIVQLDSPQAGVQRVIFRLEAAMHSKAGPNKLFASMAQYWVQQNGKWVIAVTQRSNLARLPQPIAPKPDLYPDPAEARTDIGLALSVAAREHKRVLLDFGGNWCYDCHVLDAAFHYPAIEKIVEANYIIVHINIGEYDKNLDLAEKYQIPLKKGVPSLAVLDGQGDLVVSQKHGDFEDTSKIGPGDIEKFLEEWKPRN